MLNRAYRKIAEFGFGDSDRAGRERRRERASPVFEVLRGVLPQRSSRTGNLAEEQTTSRSLLDRLSGVDEQLRRDIACGLSVMWDGFIEHHGNLDGFLKMGPEEQKTYIDWLRQSAALLNNSAVASRGHLGLAPDLLAGYLEAFARHDRSETDLQLGQAVTRLIDRGRLVRRAAAARPQIGPPR